MQNQDSASSTFPMYINYFTTVLVQVHARCYGELEPIDGILWYCNLCRAGTPESPPPCCLCPIIGIH